MTPADEALEFRRILVALDASKESLAALDVATTLAARLQAEIMGLFIEDADLLNLAALPFSREAPMLSRAGRLLDPTRLEQELKSKAAIARQALARRAESLHLQWSFRTTRGRVDTELLAASTGADLIAVGKSMRPMTGDVRLGRHARAVAAQTERSMLFASALHCPADAPLAAVYDGSSRSNAALALAARMAEREGRRLLVFILGQSPVDFARHEIAVREQVRALGLSASVRRVRGTGLQDVVRALQAESVELLVVGSQAQPSDEGAALDILVENSACSVLLARA